MFETLKRGIAFYRTGDYLGGNRVAFLPFSIVNRRNLSNTFSISWVTNARYAAVIFREDNCLQTSCFAVGAFVETAGRLVSSWKLEFAPNESWATTRGWVLNRDAGLPAGIMFRKNATVKRNISFRNSFRRSGCLVHFKFPNHVTCSILKSCIKG